MAQQRGALWAFYYGRHSRDDQKKKEKKERVWQDGLCCSTNSRQEDKRLKSWRARERGRELQRGFTLHERKGLHTGFCSHMHRNTVNPPSSPSPHLPPLALINSHCLSLSLSLSPLCVSSNSTSVTQLLTLLSTVGLTHHRGA